MEKKLEKDLVTFYLRFQNILLLLIAHFISTHHSRLSISLFSTAVALRYTESIFHLTAITEILVIIILIYIDIERRK